MELNEKLQELRKQKGLTQEELAEFLFVSRTAISKWESGRGYPNIDSLKAIAKFFGITIDALLSGDELLVIAEEETQKARMHICDLVFGLLDCSVAMFFFMPLFGQKAETIRAVALPALTQAAPYTKAAFFALTIAMIVSGILQLALQNCRRPFWTVNKSKLSLGVNALGALLLIIGLQPYAAALLVVFLVIKAAMLIKWQ